MWLLVRTEESAKKTLVRLDEVAKEVGLNTNKEDTKIMTKSRRKTTTIQNMALNDYNFE